MPVLFFSEVQLTLEWKREMNGIQNKRKKVNESFPDKQGLITNSITDALPAVPLPTATTLNNSES